MDRSDLTRRRALGGLAGLGLAAALPLSRAWAEEGGINPETLTLKPEDLGMRITYFVSEPVTETSVPSCDFAAPFA